MCVPSRLQELERYSTTDHTVRDAHMAFVSPEEAHDLKSEGWVHIDLRDPDHFLDSRAAESVNLPFQGSGDSFLSEIAARFSRQDKLLISSDVHSCRCARAVVSLAARGYDNLRRVHGGHEAWVSNPDLPTESGE